MHMVTDKLGEEQRDHRCCSELNVNVQVWLETKVWMRNQLRSLRLLSHHVASYKLVELEMVGSDRDYKVAVCFICTC
jgi:hypothetical protein